MDIKRTSENERIVHVVEDIAWLPTPNRVEVVLTAEIAPADLTRTAFMIPVGDDGSVLLAVNRRRGLEIPGGHVEPGESLLEAATREAYEETGAWVVDARPLGYLRMTVADVQPDDYAYPYPRSYQQFYAGRLIDLDVYAANDECLEPAVITALDDPRLTGPTMRWFCEAALETPHAA